LRTGNVTLRMGAVMSRTRKTVIAILAAAGLALGLGAAAASGGTGHYAAGSQMYYHG